MYNVEKLAKQTIPFTCTKLDLKSLRICINCARAKISVFTKPNDVIAVTSHHFFLSIWR